MSDTPIDVEAVRKEFPLLSRRVHGRPITYLDSASTSLQPRAVLSAMDHYYETTHANVHRGVFTTAEEATRLYDRAHQERDGVAQPRSEQLGAAEPPGR
jgi:cysteine desulfurase / selenocysteine lyase